jgi:MFS family permease
VVFIDTAFFTAITPLLPHYVQSLGLSKSSAGLLVASYAAGTLLGSIPSGIVASRLGVRTAVVAGMTLMAGSTLAFGFLHQIALLDLARFVQGAGGACTWAGALGWLAQAAPPSERAAALGIAFSAAVGGSLVGPLIGAIASGVGTGPTFAGATAAAGVLVLASLAVHVPAGEASPSLRGAISALRDSSLLGGLWLTGLAGLALGVVDVLLPLRLNALGASAIGIALTFLGASALEGVLAPLIGRMADRKGRLLPVRLSIVGAIAVSVLLPQLSRLGLLIAVAVIGMPSFGTLFVPAAALTSDGAQRRNVHQGLGFGLSNLAWAGGQAIASAGGGALARATSDTVVYLALAGIFAATLGGLSAWRRTGWLTHGAA